MRLAVLNELIVAELPILQAFQRRQPHDRGAEDKVPVQRLVLDQSRGSLLDLQWGRALVSHLPIPGSARQQEALRRHTRWLRSECEPYCKAGNAPTIIPCPATLKSAQQLPSAISWPTMIHVVALIGAVIWFGLVGLLWYIKPGDVYWLLGSAVLGVVYFAGFFSYLRLTDSRHAARSPEPAAELSSETAGSASSHRDGSPSPALNATGGGRAQRDA